jgi:Zn2+/Cd2+-exporting ATPase
MEKKDDEPRQHGCASCEHCHAESRLPQEWLVGISGFLTAAGFSLTWLKLGPEWWAQSLFAAATLAGALLVFPAAWGALKKRRLDINVLMAVAVTGAWCIGEGAEAASVVFLFSLSELLESWATGRARRAIESLLKLSPPTAWGRDDDGTQREIPVDEIRVGTEIFIKSGSRIPLDGEVSAGNSSVDQAAITGESLPVEKSLGDPVYAGTLNGEGSLSVRVTKSATESTLARIIQLVGEAEQQKPPTQRFVDRFAAVYTPVIFAIALLVAVVPPLVFSEPWSFWLYRALVLLVISCPCALVIATPVSIVSGLTALARRGVLVKGGVHLETVGKLRALAVDKTGTLTLGQPKVLSILSCSDLTEDEILAAAAAINSHSQHPLALAITEAATARGLAFPEASNYRSVTGRGAFATVGGQPHFIGNPALAAEQAFCGLEYKDQIARGEEKGHSLAVLGRLGTAGEEGIVLGIIATADTLRPNVAAALQRIREAGVEHIILLSGDHQQTVSNIAAQAGIREAIGGLMPDEKVQSIKQLLTQYTHVGMVGDGVNDAPALALASVGFAMGAIGSDTAIETADIALMEDDLSKVADAILMGQRTLRMIRFNVIFALSIKALFLVLAMTGHAGLWLAILADTGATLLVILNALRLLGSRGRPA